MEEKFKARDGKMYDKYNEEEVYKYNIAYGLIFKWIKTTCALRKQDVELRQEDRERRRQQRIDQLATQAQMIEEKEAALEQRKAEIAPEETEAFNEEEWLATWDAEHPLPDIIAEVVDEFDRDIDE